MTTEQVQALGPALVAFLRPLQQFFENSMAIEAGVPPRNLQQFLKACLWDHDGLVDEVQQRLLATVAESPRDPIGTVAILDETSALKKGDKTPGVQRQYLGCVGKIANGVVTVAPAV